MPREAGRVEILDPGSDRPILLAATLQCVHCGRHWVPKPGSGIVRGYCARCNGPICGPSCAVCVPQEQQLENMEAGRPIDYRPVRLSVPRLWTPGQGPPPPLSVRTPAAGP